MESLLKNLDLTAVTTHSEPLTNEIDCKTMLTVWWCTNCKSYHLVHEVGTNPSVDTPDDPALLAIWAENQGISVKSPVSLVKFDFNSWEECEKLKSNTPCKEQKWELSLDSEETDQEVDNEEDEDES